MLLLLKKKNTKQKPKVQKYKDVYDSLGVKNGNPKTQHWGLVKKMVC